MDQKILNYYSRINHLNVSRETFLDFENYISMILEKNKKINIISQNTASKKAIIDRHIIDSAQIIDFVDLNCNTTCDIGTGGGMPGLIVAIVMKKIKNDMRINLYEKSHHKSVFLKEVSKKLNLNTNVIQKDIFTVKNIETGTIMSRAFKPLPVILDLVSQNFRRYKNIILFMGRTGKKTLNDTLKGWDLDYEVKKSLTNDDSFILNIKKIKKKIS
jgi:16S rRNA (guanine527-N7)-methyltransferase